MFIPKTNYAKIAYDAILFFISTGLVKKTDPMKISADLKLNRACVVSIFDNNDKLRGRFGGILPREKFLFNEIVENAVSAASKDKNNEPIKSDELNQIKVCVEILSIPNRIEDFNELKPKKHGLFIEDSTGKTGFIMPNSKGIKTIDDQIKKVKEIAGITEKDNSVLEILYFKSTLYD